MDPVSPAEPPSLPPPPDGSPLASLEERRAWLSVVQVAYALPREGLLWMPDGPDGPLVAVDAATVRAVVPEGPNREAPVTDGAREELVGAWVGAWRSAPAEVGDVLLHYRGLFRVADSDVVPALAAWLAERLAG